MLTVFSLRFLFDAVSNVIRSAGEVLLPVGAIVGLLLGLLGFRLYKFTLFIFGFALGALIGLVIGFLAGDLGSAFAVALIAGLISGLLALFLEALGVFLMGAAFGGLLGLILAAASNDATATVTVALVLAILGGVVALFVRKVFVIVATSVLGALLVTGAVVAALRTSLGSPPVPILLMLVLFAAFIVVQFATTRHIVRGAPRSDLIEPPIANPTQQRAESKEPLPKENERPHQTRARASVRKILFVALPVAIIAFAGYSIYSNYASKRSVTTNNKITVEEALDSIGQEFSKNPRLIDDLASSNLQSLQPVCEQLASLGPLIDSVDSVRNITIGQVNVWTKLKQISPRVATIDSLVTTAADIVTKASALLESSNTVRNDALELSSNRDLLRKVPDARSLNAFGKSVSDLRSAVGDLNSRLAEIRSGLDEVSKDLDAAFAALDQLNSVAFSGLGAGRLLDPLRSMRSKVQDAKDQVSSIMATSNGYASPLAAMSEIVSRVEVQPAPTVAPSSAPASTAASSEVTTGDTTAQESSQPQEHDLALSATASASSQLEDTNPNYPAPASKAIDGIKDVDSSRWVTNTKAREPHWIAVDLRGRNYVDTVRLYMYGTHTWSGRRWDCNLRDYTINLYDGETRVSSMSITDNRQQSPVYQIGKHGSKVELVISNAGDDHIARLYEIEIMGYKQ